MPWLAWLSGCGGGIDCRDPGQVLAQPPSGAPLVCADATAVVEWMELLAGREVGSTERKTAAGALAAQFQADPVAVRALVDAVRAEGTRVSGLTDTAGAEARSHQVYLAEVGTGLLRPEHGTLWNLQSKAMSVWTRDEEEQLAMTESDLEAWIRYASLCREIQGGAVLRVSVGDRVTVYQQLIGRFDSADRANQVALASLGPIWPSVVDAWKLASYERQQAFVSAAPLPPPMNATSMGYAEAVFDGDLAGHVRALTGAIGPFPVGHPEDFATTPPPGSAP